MSTSYDVTLVFFKNKTHGMRVISDVVGLFFFKKKMISK
jgi:hypothetical protein